MKKLMIAAVSAVAVGLSAFAAGARDWFDAGVATGWPTATSLSGGAWSDGATDAAYLNGSTLEIDAEAASPLQFVANTRNLQENAENVFFDASVTFTPFDELPDVSTVPEGAKAGVVVAPDSDENYYFWYLNKGDTGLYFAKINNSLGTAPDAAALTKQVTISANYAENSAVVVTYKIGDFEAVSTSAEYPITTDAEFGTVDFTGSGELTALSGTFDPLMVTFTIPSVGDNATFVVSNDNKEISAPYTAEALTDVIITYKTIGDYVFDSGNGSLTTKQVVVPATSGELETGVTADNVKPAKARIGTVLYLSFDAAATNALDNETITLLDDDVMTLAFRAQIPHITIDLANKQLSLGATLTAECDKTCEMTIKNGNLLATSETSIYYIRSFGAEVKLDNVNFNVNNLLVDPRIETQEVDLYSGAITIINGKLTMVNGSTITGVPAGLYAIAADNYTGNNYANQGYEIGKIDLGDATVDGNVLLCGGSIAAADATVNGQLEIGAGSEGWCTAAAFGADSGYGALLGVFAVTNAGGERISGKVQVYKVNVTGIAYRDYEAALSALSTSEYDTLTMLAAAEIDENKTLTDDFTLDLNGQLVTINEGWTLTANGSTVVITNSGALVNGLAIDGTIEMRDGATVDASSLTCKNGGAGGLIQGCKGGLEIDATSTFKMMSEWASYTPNWLAANREGFLAAQEGATIYMGSTKWTCGELAWVKESTMVVTKATVAGVAGYDEAFDTIAAALAMADSPKQLYLIENSDENVVFGTAIGDSFELVSSPGIYSGTVSTEVADAKIDWTTGTLGGTLYTVVANSSPIPEIKEDATPAEVNAAIDQANFTDTKVKTLINGSATKYLQFKAWAGGVEGGEAAVVASEFAADSYTLSAITDSDYLFVNKPELKVASIAAGTGDAEGNWVISSSLKDGDDTIAINLEALADFIQISNAPDTGYDAATVEVVEDTLVVTPIEGNNFMKILVTK